MGKVNEKKFIKCGSIKVDTWTISAKLKLPSMLTLIVADLPEKLKLPSILTIIADKKCGCRNSKLRV